MTTIVYRDGILAADRRAYSGDQKPVGTKTKIHRLGDGSLWGVSTNCVGGDAAIRRWLEGGCSVPSSDDQWPESFELLLIRPDGGVFLAVNNLDLTGPLTADFYAVGTGDRYAVGAMAMGASAEQAVAVASEMDIWTGGGVDTLTL